MSRLPDLPSGWTWSTLGEIGVWSGGATPRKSESRFWTGGTIPWLSPKDMGSPVLADTQDHLHGSAVSDTNLKVISGPSVAIVVRSGILERKVPVALVPFDTTLNQDMKAVKPADGIVPEWLAYALQSMETALLRDCRKAGTTVASLEFDRVLSMPLAVPPTDEQRRIVAALEERLTQLDVTAADGAATVRKLAAARDRLLARFLAQEGEATATIGEIAAVGSGATPLKSETAYYDGGTVPWVTSADLNAGVVTTARHHITELAVKETSVKLWSPGTLLVAMYGEGQTRGRCARLDIAATTNQACAAIVLHPHSPVTSEFLHMFLDASYARTRWLSAGGVQPNLSLGLIRGIEVPVRSTGAQRDLVERTRAALEQIELTRQGLSRLIGRSTMLRRSLLAAAFRGRLADQDPVDEPADLLLKRIAEERAAAGATAPRRRARTVRTTALAAIPTEESA